MIVSLISMARICKDCFDISLRNSVTTSYDSHKQTVQLESPSQNQQLVNHRSTSEKKKKKIPSIRGAGEVANTLITCYNIHFKSEIA